MQDTEGATYFIHCLILILLRPISNCLLTYLYLNLYIIQFESYRKTKEANEKTAKKKLTNWHSKLLM